MGEKFPNVVLHERKNNSLPDAIRLRDVGECEIQRQFHTEKHYLPVNIGKPDVHLSLSQLDSDKCSY